MKTLRKVFQKSANNKTKDEVLAIIKEHFSDMKMKYKDTEDSAIFIQDEYKCLELVIYPSKKHIHLSSLRYKPTDVTKCKSGSDLLDSVIDLKEKLNFTLDLDDASTIKYEGANTNDTCILPLAELKIFASGESWYNSKGFYSKKYRQEFEYNKKIRELTVKQLFDQVIDYMNTDEYKEDMKNELMMMDEEEKRMTIEFTSIETQHKNYNDFLRIFQVNPNEKIGDVFQRIDNKIKSHSSQCDEEVQNLHKMLLLFGSKIKYNELELQYQENFQDVSPVESSPSSTSYSLFGGRMTKKRKQRTKQNKNSRKRRRYKSKKRGYSHIRT